MLLTYENSIANILPTQHGTHRLEAKPGTASLQEYRKPMRDLTYLVSQIRG